MSKYQFKKCDFKHSGVGRYVDWVKHALKINGMQC